MGRKNRLVDGLREDAERASKNGDSKRTADPIPEEQHGDAWEPPEDRSHPPSNGEAVPPEPALAAPPAYQPFPLAALPQPVRDYVDAAAAAVNVDPAFVALPLLTTLAGAIGNSRRLQLKRSWTEPAILWGAIVGESGTQKSPAVDMAKKFLRHRQQKAMKRYREAMEVFQADMTRYERDFTAWKRTKVETQPPEKPDAPVCERCLVDDTTVEALAPILLGNWRGVTIVKDELAGWLGAFDRYAGKGKQGSDAAKWLEMFGGRSVVIDRKTGIPPTLFVPMAAVSVCGGIQPGTLRRAISQEHRDNGLLARLLLVWPARRQKQWTDADVDFSLVKAVGAIFDRLFELAPIKDDDGDLAPKLVTPSPEAKALFIDFANSHGQEQMSLDGDLAAAWSKLEGYAARFALIHHLVRCAANEIADEGVLEVVSMAAGIELVNWFAAEARRVYEALDESEQDRETAELLTIIHKRGGTITARALARSGPRKYRQPGKAETVLETMVKKGLGRWDSVATNGRNARVFVAW